MKRVLGIAGVGVVAVALAVVALRPPSTERTAPGEARESTEAPATPRAPATSARPVRPAPGPARADAADAGDRGQTPDGSAMPSDPHREEVLARPEGVALTRSMAPWAQLATKLKDGDWPDAELLHTEAKHLVADLQAWREEPERFSYGELEGRQLGLIAHIRQVTRGDPSFEPSFELIERNLRDAREAMDDRAPLEPLPPPSRQHLGR